MKHFFNRRENIVTEALDGLLLTSSAGRLARLDSFPDIKVILRADWDKSKVAIISGGGAGHEPSHAGFVGKGMLTAAVSGEIFASPSVDAVLTAIRAVAGPKGALLIVKNYTGDRLNFGLAAEKARAEGFDVEMVIVADDIAIPGINQPRGVAGTLFVHKIAGYHAERGEDLKTVAAHAAAAAGDIVSLGMSLSTCSVPGQAHEDRLGENEGELGLGIHGEPGVERIALQPVADIVATMVARLTPTLREGRNHALLINNLGAVPPLEMTVIANVVLSSPLADRIRLIIGPAPMMTALNMNGFSLSLIRLDAVREAALTAVVEPHAWMPAVERHEIQIIAAPRTSAGLNGANGKAGENDRNRRLITALCEHLISQESELNRLDGRVGDGDTGSTVASGARSVLARLDTLPLDRPAATLASLGDILGTSMGGSSGVLLSIFFTAAAKAMADKADISAALLAGLDRMTFYGGAGVGDRTMVDALSPALQALASGDVAAAARAAAVGAESTKMMMKARAGRASYVGERDLAGVADPGAVAVAGAFGVAASLA
ncbi:dihydroxyacetone kinase subunit DhaK [Rhizobium ruizarguesonis]|jgi:dihydroxyacetone kinase|uniref:dihydroxyacetone kinase subunit DhaK n=1 Tax=Rhizobium ruizarguesonis TaxID=2081791 RepID=UPI0003736AD8|nr:dihydroxyacetone kinase subunit DhaK [Rhizobium ruizarguesonis]MBY5833418.1 DAK2 domain-containing protein [Rhizobium leguminosarum]QJS28153.1 DAK2 domain-containing protein [Rhizobium leguminosarum bv. trifolii TA1]MBY5852962.1 DAK2 domain-containing protein [Rhizobium leguminosarum]MBY5861911.1 DAK2 domain-containing protein [Rhizobium leguminosarum]MBY5875930.1 DAK2 domain-containing protein [Rhizobium leguminosarum]